MTNDSSYSFWQPFPAAYRAKEMATLADWIMAGESGAVVGLAGTGRATLLGFLCHRPDALALYLGQQAQRVRLIPVDLNNLPGHDLATLYRVILRSFYENRERFDKVVQPLIETIFRRYERDSDPFLPQSGLRELLLHFQAQQMRIVLVMNRFDAFCQAATFPMTNTLRGLRDSFKDTLSFIMGMRQDVIYLSGLDSVKPLRGLLDTHTCWVRPLAAEDGRFMLRERLPDQQPGEAEIGNLLALTGGYPSLLRIACHWYRQTAAHPPPAQWATTLLPRPNAQHRLHEWWQSLNQEEQAVLAEVQKGQIRAWPGQPAQSSLARQHEAALASLETKGACQPEGTAWRIIGDLPLAYVGQVAGRSRGRLWLDEASGEIYQGQLLLRELSPQEQALLQFLLHFPRVRHTHDDLIEGAWPPEDQKGGISTEALYQAVRSTRKKIEPDPSQPRYLVTWRGQREGGYQLFPEGRPG